MLLLENAYLCNSGNLLNCSLMDRTNSRKRLKHFVLLVFVVVLPLFTVAQTGDDVVKRLVEMGFENVAWAEDDARRVYLLENSTYRLSGVGIGKALDEIQKWGLPDGAKECRLIVLENNVPIISLYCTPDSLGNKNKDVTRNDWYVSYDIDSGWDLVKGKDRRNSSLYKVDILVYPMFSFKNGRLTVPYQVRLNINPTLEASLWRGGKVVAQLVVPVVNDYGYRYDDVRPGYLTLSQGVRLPYKFFLTGTVGFFGNSRNGVDLKLEHFPTDGGVWFEARASYTIFGEWGEWKNGKNIHPFKFGYDKNSAALTGYVGANYYWKRLASQLSLRAERYLEGEYGVRFDLIRHMKYCSIGFYGMYIPSDWHNDGINGGFRFVINLPPYKYKRRGYIPRIMPSRGWGFDYNAGGTYVYGQSFKADVQENIGETIQYNPSYLKQELLNF